MLRFYFLDWILLIAIGGTLVAAVFRAWRIFRWFLAVFLLPFLVGFMTAPLRHPGVRNHFPFRWFPGSKPGQ